MLRTKREEEIRNCKSEIHYQLYKLQKIYHDPQITLQEKMEIRQYMHSLDVTNFRQRLEG